MTRVPRGLLGFASLRRLRRRRPELHAPVFLAVVGSALSLQGLATAYLQFVSFALGWVSSLPVVTFGTASQGRTATLLTGLPHH